MEHTTDTLTETTSSPKREDFTFHAQGGEYFRIWIVNLVLTLLTLGIYSAWATVRTKKYFYGSTELAGDRFEYLADPIVILKGRLIAIAALVVYTVLQTLLPIASLFLLLGLILLVPWIAVRSLRFNAIMSAWRGIRFGFDGTVKGAAQAYVLWPLFGIVTLGFGMPYAWHKQNQFKFTNHRFGESRTKTSATAKDFYQIFYALFAAGIGGGVAIVIVVSISSLVFVGATEETSSAVSASMVVAMALYLAFYVMLYVIYEAMSFKIVFGNLSVDQNRFRTDVTIMGWFKVIIINTLAMVFTLGVYYPWARVRLTSYILAHLWIDAEDLASFTAHERDKTSALGAEMGDAFDLGIGI